MVGRPTMAGVCDKCKAIKTHRISRIIDLSKGNAVNHKAWIYIHAPAVTANTEDRLCITAMFMHTGKDTMLRSYILAWLPQGY